MKRKKYLIIIAVFLVFSCIATFLGYSYLNKPHRNIAEGKAIVHISAGELHEKFITPSPTEEDLTDEIIELSGLVTEIEAPSTVFIEDKVQVDFDIEKQALEDSIHGSNIIIKGRCVGFDDLLEIVKIDQAVIITQQ